MSIFAAVPLALLEDARLTPRQFRFMVAVYSFCPRGKNVCFPSRALLAKRARLPIPRVSEVSAQLVELGWLAKEGNGGRGRATRYTILTPETVTKAVTVTDLVTVTGTVTVTDGEDGAATDEETVAETVTVTETVTVSEPEAQNGYRFKQKTVTDLVTPIEETRNRQESAKADVPPLPPTKPKRAKREPMQPLHCSAELGQRWLQNRRETGARVLWNENTQARHDSEAAKAGITPEAAYVYAMQRGWQAFHARPYLQDEKPQQNGAPYKSAYERKCEAMHQWAHIDEILGEPEKQDNVIDVSVRPANREQFQLLEQK